MIRYIALLRGVNIGGKNKVPMAELKRGFEKIAFEEVKTYLNSGNVIFSSNEDDTQKIGYQIEAMIQNEFDLEIPVFVISTAELIDILHHVPKWWEKITKKFIII